MMIVPAGVKIHMAFGYTDKRREFDGLAMLIQETLQQDAFWGQCYRRAKPKTCHPRSLGETATAARRVRRDAKVLTASGQNVRTRILFVFRGRRADLIKILSWDGSGICLFSKRLEQGQFSWPVIQTPGQAVQLNRTQLGMLLEGVNLRMPERRWRPQRAG